MNASFTFLMLHNALTDAVIEACSCNDALRKGVDSVNCHLLQLRMQKGKIK